MTHATARSGHPSPLSLEGREAGSEGARTAAEGQALEAAPLDGSASRAFCRNDGALTLIPSPSPLEGEGRLAGPAGLDRPDCEASRKSLTRPGKTVPAGLFGLSGPDQQIASGKSGRLASEGARADG